MSVLPLTQQVAVVMGASSGVGRATGLRLAELGAQVLVSARDQAALDGVAEQILRHGGKALAVTADHQGSTGLCITVHFHRALPSLAATAAEVCGGLMRR